MTPGKSCQMYFVQKVTLGYISVPLSERRSLTKINSINEIKNTLFLFNYVVGEGGGGDFARFGKQPLFLCSSTKVRYLSKFLIKS